MVVRYFSDFVAVYFIKVSEAVQRTLADCHIDFLYFGLLVVLYFL